MDADLLALGALWYVVFLLSTTCHEAAHAFVAKLGGDLTAFHGGQVTLDPMPHIRREPFGMVLFPLLSYFAGGWMMGWASAPYDPLWSQRHPHRAAWMSLAGPGANLCLAILAGIAIHLGIWIGAFRPPDSVTFTQIVLPATPGIAEAAAKFVSLLFSLNIMLGAFNLLPIPPLDGFTAIGLFMPERFARRLEAFGQSQRAFSYLGVLVGWQLFGYIYGPILGLSLITLYPWATYGS